jgi:DUF4097 and DUF4098 domain-containing protein YvlB
MSSAVSANIPETGTPSIVKKSESTYTIEVKTSNTAKVSERFEQIYPLGLNGTVEAKNISGDIKLTTWDSPQVRLIAIKTASNDQRMKDLSLDIDSDANSFSVKAKYRRQDKDEDWSDRGGHLSVAYELTVPRTAVLESIASVSGNVSIDGASNDSKASSVSGDVIGRNLGGTARLSSVSGEVEADFSTVAAGGNIKLSSVSGRVNLNLPSYVGATFSASTVSGKIENDFGVEVKEGKYIGSSMKGSVGDGSIRVKLSSVSGTVRVSKNEAQ